MPDSPEFSIIIPTLRAGDDLAGTLRSIEADQTSPSYEIIVVFNCPKPTELTLREWNLKARYIQADTNLGFAAACNLGAGDAVGETLVFLNDDMTVAPGWLRAYSEKLGEGEYPAIGGRILSPDGKKVDFAGSSINLTGWGFQKGHGEDVTKDEFDNPSRLPFGCGGNFAIKSDIYHESGGFDPHYFAYFEDVDLGWRIRLMGHEIGYSEEATTYHKSGSTGAFMPPALKWFLQERNALITVIKNYSDETFYKILPAAISLAGVRSLILSDLTEEDFAPDRTWREWVMSLKPDESEQRAVWNWLLDNVKDSLKSGMKSTRKAGLPVSYLPMKDTAVAGLFALEWCMNNWTLLMEKRKTVQVLRRKKDVELVPMLGDALRSVLGHPREIEAMKPLEKILSDILKTGA